MIVVCPKCGVKNSIPEFTDPRNNYLCAKCRTRLTITPKVRVPEKSRGAVTRPDGTDTPGLVQVEKSAAHQRRLTSVVSWLQSRETQLILGLAALALVIHLLAIPYSNVQIYDERYYVFEARSIIHGGSLTTPEHPSLGKLFITSGILIFGDNPWGWRVPSAIFGVAAVVIFYLICRRLADRLTALFAAILFLFESLTFAISGLAMLDAFSLTFMLLAFLFYLQDKYVISGVSLGLSALCKMTGMLGIMVILLHWLIKRRKGPPRRIVFFLISTSVVFLGLMPVVDFAATREWLNPLDRLSFAFSFMQGLSFDIAPTELRATENPWQWILNPIGVRIDNIYWYVLRISPTVFIMIIPSMGYMAYKFASKKTDIALFAILWFAVTYLSWVALVFLTDRVTYYYYFYPTVGAVCMAIGFALNRFWQISSEVWGGQYRELIKISIIGYFVVHAWFWLYFAPILGHSSAQVT